MGPDLSLKGGIALLLVALILATSGVPAKALPAATYLASCQGSPWRIGQDVLAHEGEWNYLIDDILVVKPVGSATTVGYVWVHRRNGKAFFGPAKKDPPLFDSSYYAGGTMTYIGEIKPGFSINKALAPHERTKLNYTLQPCFARPWNHRYPKK